MHLFAVSPADAAAEAFANKDNQVYFGKGHISLREGECFNGGQNKRTHLREGNTPVFDAGLQQGMPARVGW